MSHNFKMEDADESNGDKTVIIKELIDIIENSINISERIEALKKLNLNEFHLEKGYIDQENTFTFFENLLISDSNEKVREEAAKFIYHNYINKAVEPLNWVLHHETSANTLSTVYELLISIISRLVTDDNSDSKAILVKLITQMDDKDFKVGIAELTRTKDLSVYKPNEIGAILRNYFAHTYIKRRYWRVKYKIENCKITELDFIFKGLSHLPIAIKELTALKELILRYNQINYLPEWLGNLTALEILNININSLIELPLSIGKLTNLKELLLWKNELRTLPDSIGFLKNLKKLNLRLNQLENLPSSFGNLTNLVDLNLHDNKLKFLPESFPMLSCLELLNLSWNNIETLPQSIGNLKNLKTLDLERNELKVLPSSIGSLYSLEYLNLRDNKLRSLPQSLSKLINLKVLNISRNLLEKCPEMIIQCPTLEEVFLGENNFTITTDCEEILNQKGVSIHF